jgi:hypothetical protein
LRKGENPFDGSMRFLKIVGFLLLRYQKPLTPTLLSAAFVSKLGWQKPTADAHARIAIQALTHIGAVDNNEGSITLRRA